MREYLLVGGQRSGQTVTTCDQPFWRVPHITPTPVVPFSQDIITDPVTFKCDEYHLESWRLSNGHILTAYFLIGMNEEQIRYELDKLHLE